MSDKLTITPAAKLAHRKAIAAHNPERYHAFWLPEIITYAVARKMTMADLANELHCQPEGFRRTIAAFKAGEQKTCYKKQQLAYAEFSKRIGTYHSRVTAVIDRRAK